MPIPVTLAPTGCSRPSNSTRNAIITRAMSRRQNTMWPRASEIRTSTGCLRQLSRFPNFALPRFGDPIHHGKREFLLPGEEVIQRPAGVSGFACDLLEDEVAVPIARKSPRRRLEQGGSGACATLGLRPRPGIRI